MSDPTTTPTPTEPQDVRERHQIVSVGRSDLPGGVYVKCRCDEHVLIPAAAYTDHVLAAVSAASPKERADAIRRADALRDALVEVARECARADAAEAALAARPAPTVSGECDHAKAAREIARTTPLSLDAATALIDSLARGAATLADAWDEGFVAGYADGTETGMTDPPNPYRTVTDWTPAEEGPDD